VGLITRRDRGQATVEVALFLPVVMALLGALLEVGMLAADHVRLWHAAREAARVAVVERDSHAARAAVTRSGLKNVRVDIEPDQRSRILGEPLTVTLSYSPSARVPLIGELFESVHLSAKATMRIEQP
jgi:Flp pilus assembly protein TadG